MVPSLTKTNPNKVELSKLIHYCRRYRKQNTLAEIEPPPFEVG